MFQFSFQSICFPCQPHKGCNSMACKGYNLAPSNHILEDQMVFLAVLLPLAYVISLVPRDRDRDFQLRW